MYGEAVKKRKLGLMIWMLLLVGLTGCGRSPQKMADRGLKALEGGDPEEAVVWLEQALLEREEDESAAMLWGGLGLARARAGHPGPAEDAFRIAQRLAPEDYQIHFNYGGLLMNEGRYLEAIDAFDVAARVAPGRTEALEMMAASAIRMDDRGRALRWMTEAASRREDPRVLTSLATLNADAGRVQEVRTLLRRALDLDPAYAPATFNLAAFLDQQDLDPAQAVHYYQRYLNLNGDPALASQIRERMQVLSARLGEAGGDRRAQVTREVQEILAQAEAAGRAGNVQAALNHCLRAAALAGRQGRPDLEERALRIGIHTASEQPRAHFAFGRFLLAQSRPAEALAAYRDASSIAPNWLPAWRGQAEAAIAANQPAVAREALQQAERLAVDDPDTLLSLMDLYRDGLRDDAAVRRMQRDLQSRFSSHPRVRDFR